MLAKRVAWEQGTTLGELVGYQVRHENRTTAQTRIVYVTEAILLRRLLKEPDLRTIGAVIFDEFHERHLYGDVSLAMLRRLQQTERPDLRLAVMSATLATRALEGYMPEAVVLRSEGRTFPVTVEFVKAQEIKAAAVVRNEPDLADLAVRVCRRLCSEHLTGDVLIFMPGAYEIRKTMEGLQRVMGGGFRILALHGDMPAESQDAVMERCQQRRIIVATNIAETSLTIDGIELVIDSGRVRQAAHDVHRGINTLWIEKISRASADQRAGRAGRTAPGHCCRLWTESDHAARPEFTEPEIRRLELSELLLLMLAAGVGDPHEFPWFEVPPVKALDNSLTLLRRLGALPEVGYEPTALGKAMAALPLHPRYARMLLAACERDCVEAVALACAVAQGRSVLMPLRNRDDEDARIEMLCGGEEIWSDIQLEMLAVHAASNNDLNTDFGRRWGIHIQGCRLAVQVMRQLLSLCARGVVTQSQDIGNEVCSVQPLSERIAQCILLGFVDHLAIRTDSSSLRCALAGGRRGEVSPHSHIKKAPLFVAAEIEEFQAGRDVTVRLGMNTVIERVWLQALFGGEFSETIDTTFDPQMRRVVSRRNVSFGDLILESGEAGEVDKSAAASILAHEVEAGRLVLKNWGEKADELLRRIQFLAMHCPELGIAPLDQEARLLLLEALFYGHFSYKSIKDLPVIPALLDWAGPGAGDLLDRYAPERIQLAKGFNARIRYEADGRAFVSGTIQQFYDTTAEQLRVAGGKVALIVELLAPSRRPVQVTSDLDNFWTTSYPSIRKELKGRYPKHEWR
ncbi:MAG: helicase [Verrucomicrobia bacterium]|nr:helicase [Verrucomicrobiota bacterium]